MRASAILVIGGYGHVGRRIVSGLKEFGHSDVVIAGRNTTKAKTAAVKLSCRFTRIDLNACDTWDEALNDVGIVVVCMDQDDATFAAHVLSRGLGYVNITASDVFFRKVEALGALAVRNGGSALLSVGLAPGLTNLLVRACAEKMHRPKVARIGIMLGAGDAHGRAALEWTLEQFAHASMENAPFTSVAFGPGRSPCATLPVDFADQHVVRRTLGIPCAETFLGFAPAWQSRIALSFLRWAAKRAWTRRLALATMPHLAVGSDRAVLNVEVSGEHRGEEARFGLALEGRKEADITALVAAAATHRLSEGGPSGVWHLEQIVSLADLAGLLRLRGVYIRKSRSFDVGGQE